MRITILLFTSILLISTSLSAQEKWSLEKCIEYAIENNIQVKMQDLSTKSSNEAYLKSKMTFLPNLNGSASQNYALGRSVDPYTNQFSERNVSSNNFSLSSSLTLFNGFQNINSLKQASLNFQASLEDLQKAKNDISLNLASAFLQILFSDELVYVAQNQVELSKQQTDRNKKLFEAGSIAQGNYLEMQSQLASDEMQLVSAENQLVMSNLTLSQILELGFNDSIQIEKPSIPDPELNFILPDPETVYTEALQKLPQIKSAELRMKSAQKGLAVAQGYRSPRLTLSGGISTMYSSNSQKISNISLGTPQLTGYADNGTTTPFEVYSYNYNYDYTKPSFNSQLKDNNSKSISFNLTIPIFNNWQANYSVSSAKINALNYKYSYDLAEKQLQKEIQQAYADATASFRKYVASKKAVTASQESFRYIQQKFDVGMVTTVDFNLAKNNLSKAQSELIKAKYEFIFRAKILDFYRGIPIKL
jgi:outer membrane protein